MSSGAVVEESGVMWCQVERSGGFVEERGFPVVPWHAHAEIGREGAFDPSREVSGGTRRGTRRDAYTGTGACHLSQGHFRGAHGTRECSTLHAEAGS